MLLHRIRRWFHSLSVLGTRLNQSARDRISHSPLTHNRAVLLLLGIVRGMGDSESGLMAASMAYYAFFSMFPLALGLVSLLGFLHSSQAVQQQILEFFATYLPGSSQLITGNIDEVLKVRGALGVISILGLLWSSTGMFGSINRAIDRAWNVQRGRPFYVSRALQLGMALGVLALFSLSLGLTSAISLVGGKTTHLLANVPFLGLVFYLVSNNLLPFLVTFTAFIFVHKVMPSRRTHWRYIWPGAVLGAVLFEILKYGFVWYVSTIRNYAQVYGNLTSVIVLLLWVYAGSLILIFGAVVSAQYQRIFGPEARAR